MAATWPNVQLPSTSAVVAVSSMIVGRAAGSSPPLLDQVDVGRDADHAVRVVPGQVGADERLAHLARQVLGRAGADEDLLGDGLELALLILFAIALLLLR